ncbi:MAG: hypothetical protein AAGF78_02615 [Pseudomonadota bacterium]
MPNRPEGQNSSYLAPWVREMVHNQGAKPPVTPGSQRMSATVDAPEVDPDADIPA